MVEPQNGPRVYRSDLRARQAEDTRRRVVEAAVRLFSERGYAATTYAQLAAEAGVSVETVQKHGPKSELLKAAMELVSFGVEGETDIFDTDPGRAMARASSSAEAAAAVGEAMLAINEPSAGLWMTVASAAHGDERVGAFHLQMLGMIRVQVERFLRFAGDRGWLRHDVRFDDLVEAFCVTICVETYVRFVLHDRRSTDAYKDYVARTVRESILR